MMPHDEFRAPRLGADSPDIAEYVLVQREVRARLTRRDALMKLLMEVPPPKQGPRPRIYPNRPEDGNGSK
jgi:hypothetical protein